MNIKNNTKSNKIVRRKRKMSKAERTFKYTILFFVFLIVTGYEKLKELFTKVLKLGSVCGAVAAVLVMLSPLLYICAYALYCSNTDFWNAVFNLNGEVIGAFSTFFEAIN